MKEKWFLFFCLTLYKHNWLHVLKATVSKQHISKFFLQFLSTEVSYHTYTSQWPVITGCAVAPALC